MMTKKRIKSIVNAVVSLRNTITDEQAATVTALYPAWAEDAHYEAGERITYNEVLYKVLQAHDAQADWTPDVAVSLFAKVLTDPTGTILPWVQPDSTNPYMKDDKVTHNGKTWISTLDNNIWEPGAYGWEEVIA